MFFQINFSFFFSFSLRNGDTSERHQSVGKQDQDHIIQPIVSRQTVEPELMIKETVVASAPVRPMWSKFARYFRAESAARSEHEPETETDDDHVAASHLTKSSDRESLEVLLRSASQHEKPAKAAASNTHAADELSDSSLVHHSPVMSPVMLPQGPFVVRQSPVLEDDSGSDLVSSMQRIRVGGLASYFEDVERRARARTLASATARVSGGHDQGLSIEVEADQSTWAYSVTDGEWSEVTVREASGEE